VRKGTTVHSQRGSRFKNKWLLKTLPVVVLQCSCATQPPEVIPAPTFNQIAIVNAETLASLNLPASESEHFEQSVETGAAVGTVGGAIVGAAVCGPVMYGVCLAGFGFYGLLAGSVSGSVYGLYSYTGLSESDTAYVNETMSWLEHERNFQQELSTQFELQIPLELQASPEKAYMQVIVRLDRVEFIQGSGDTVQTRANASMVFSWMVEQASTTHTHHFSFESTAEDIDNLIAGDGERLAIVLEKLIAQLASEMSTTLLQLRSRPDADRLNQ
jgi:hypothetical protein